MTANTVEIREYGDLAQVATLEPLIIEFLEFATSSLATDYDIHIPLEEPLADMMSKLDQYVPPHGRTFVAEKAGKPLGMIFLRDVSDGCMEIKRLWVRPTGRGLGLGERLARRATEAAQDLGAKRLYLDSFEFMKSALRIYETIGFQRVGPYAASEVSSYDVLAPYGIYMAKSFED